MNIPSGFDDSVVLMDATSYMYRAHHAAPQKINSKGQHTAVISVFLKMLTKLERQVKTDKIIIVVDADGKNWRHDLYPEYKANRAPAPSELTTQIGPLTLLLEAMGYPLIRIPHYESDDVIATLTGQITAAGDKVIISSPDKDLCQLINDQVVVFNGSQDKFYGHAEATERVGVPPEQTLECLALVGDTTDNIPGIEGVGAKTATQLLSHFGSLKTMYENIDKVETTGIRGAKSLKVKLKEQKDQAKVSYALASLKRDVPIPLLIDQAVKKEENTEIVNWLMTSLEIA